VTDWLAILSPTGPICSMYCIFIIDFIGLFVWQLRVNAPYRSIGGLIGGVIPILYELIPLYILQVYPQCYCWTISRR
jgi:hypothetical protein